MSNRLELAMRLTVDASSIRAAKAETDRLADATRRVGTEARRATAETYRLAGEGGAYALAGSPVASGSKSEASAAAARKAALDAQRTAKMEAARREQLHSLRADNAMNARRETARRMAEARDAAPGSTGSGGGGLPGPLKTLLGLEAANQAARAFGRSFLERSRDPDRFTASGLATDTLRGLPIIGGVVGGTADLVGGGLGMEDVRGRQRTGLGIEAVNRGGGLNDQLRQIRQGGSAALDARRTAAAGATTDYNAARAFSTELRRRPNLNEFITENQLGVSNEAQGQLRLASLQSQERANASANSLGGEEDTLRKRQKEQAEAQAQVEAARQRQAKAESDADAATQAQRNKGVGYDPVQFKKNQRIDSTVEERQIAAAQARRSTEEALANAKEKQLATERQMETVGNARLKSAQDSIAAAKALIAERQNELALLKEQEGAQKGQARFFGRASELDKQQLLDISEKYKRGGLDSLTQEESDFARGASPQFADRIDRDQERRGASDPRNAAFNENLGLTGLDTVKEQIRTQSAELIEANRQVNEESAKAIKEVMEKGLKEFTEQLAQSIKTAFDTAMQNADKQAKDGKFVSSQG